MVRKTTIAELLRKMIHLQKKKTSIILQSSMILWNQNKARLGKLILRNNKAIFKRKKIIEKALWNKTKSRRQIEKQPISISRLTM